MNLIFELGILTWDIIDSPGPGFDVCTDTLILTNKIKYVLKKNEIMI